MQPPKCRTCGEAAWNHTCAGTATVEARMKRGAATKAGRKEPPRPDAGAVPVASKPRGRGPAPVAAAKRVPRKALADA